ncbi:MAG TPA: hypothetical protein VIM84_07930, partial [Gemmatimonadales bacterium]
LGDVFAAQLFAQAEAELGDLEQQFSRGEFQELVRWLSRKIYREGQRLSSVGLLQSITGSVPTHRPLVEALRRKYAALYQL